MKTIGKSMKKESKRFKRKIISSNSSKDISPTKKIKSMRLKGN
jgi:hypothetical protein